MKTLALAGTVVPTLVDATKEAQLMVVSSRGAGVFGGHVLGSLSAGLLHCARCPVAIVHGADSARGTTGEQAPVLVGIDGRQPPKRPPPGPSTKRRSGRCRWWRCTRAATPQDLRWVGPSFGRIATRAPRRWPSGWPERYPDVAVRWGLVGD
ncbi:MAG TPA: universal stress protein, partial [Mycobacterium sp.]|nr:universal stress protein [Mycobacterium sp.]